MIHFPAQCRQGQVLINTGMINFTLGKKMLAGTAELMQSMEASN